MEQSTVTLAIVGSGGAGVVSLGEMILSAAAKSGYYGLMRKSFGPQIRGGESAAILRLGVNEVANFNQSLDLLFSLDWNNFPRFADELAVSSDTLIIADTKAGPTPSECSQGNTVDFSAAAQQVGAEKANSVMLGFIGAWLGCSIDLLAVVMQARLVKLESAARELSLAAMKQGFTLWQQESAIKPRFPRLQPVSSSASQTAERWIASGNQLAGLGALESGVKFVAAYPITPASDSLEWIAQHIESVGGHLVQAEDELAAINMVIGAAYGGVPAFTATSGPGLALMAEAMGLAVASETPVVVMNVMRGGPSTGIPTKSEQSDLNMALYGLHGDAPHLVLSALGVADCHLASSWAVHLATSLQTLAILLSDQFIGQSLKILDPLPKVPFLAANSTCTQVESNYLRYQDTASGVSPAAYPGNPAGMYTADGLEHSESAVPSAKASDHLTQLNKRQRKLEHFDYGDYWADIRGSGSLALVCFGSLFTTLLEAQQQLADRGIAVQVIGLRLLQPFQRQQFVAACASARDLLVVEQNHQGQLLNYLTSLAVSGCHWHSLARPGPILITPEQVCQRVNEIQSSKPGGGQ